MYQAYEGNFHAKKEVRYEAYNFVKSIYGDNIEVCGEPDFECCGCVSKKDCEILGVEIVNSNKNQRKFCGCLANKNELLKERKPCPHNCAYCYWRK